ncbi:prepilin-type N-terminal cleavage/methylation domain-containing protein [bacterium]|nr:MAG: prepilin-type N-terminal cleavage/methylation domain-containing protein [bacterium]
MRQRGLTLIELLLALVVSTIVIMAAGNAYVTGVGYGAKMNAGRDAAARQTIFETRLSELFSHAYIDVDAANTATYFLSGDAVMGSPAAGSNSSTDEGSLVFTVLGRRLPSTLVSSTDEDFETINEKFGPRAGVTEIQIGTTPVGTDPSGQPGLYLREQTPSDSDASQGGEESKLSADIETISFEYFDGTDWQTTWDTNSMGTRRLPSSVRVTYKFRDETEEHIAVFSVPASDVTPDNPVVQEAAT